MAERHDDGPTPTALARTAALLATVAAVLSRWSRTAAAGTRQAAVTGARRASAALSVAAERSRPVARRLAIQTRRLATEARVRGGPALRRLGAVTLAFCRTVGAATLALCRRVGATTLTAAATAVDAAVPLLRRIGAATLAGIGAAEHAVIQGLMAVGARTLLLLDRVEQQVALRVGDVIRTTPATQRQRMASAPAVVEDPAEAALPAAAWQPEAERPLLARAAVGAGGVVLSLLATALVVVLVGALISGPVADTASNSVSFSLTLPEDASLVALEERSVIHASDGTVLAVLDREVDRTIVPLDTVPKHVIDAIVTAEDRKFWQHPGYDVEGIGRALVANVEAGGIEQGGSTITQQLAKAQVGTDLTLDRKISELMYAIALEKRFTKEELLEQYLNYVYFGARSYGIAAAAEEFFHKSYRDLTPDEAALLAANIRSPNTTNPRERPELAKIRRDAILADMVRQGYLPASELRALQARPLGVKPHVPKEKRIPHVVDSVVREFLYQPEFAAFGATAAQREDALYHNGLRIFTSVVPAMQAVAAEVIAEHYPRDGGSTRTAAIAAVEPTTGRILAAEGGVSYAEEQYDLATQGRRQPGSAFKPFVFATAIREGFPLTVRLEGRSPTYFAGICGWARVNPDGCRETPSGVRNYGGASYGVLDMRRALVSSVNTATAQLMLAVGPERVAEVARLMGVNMDAALRQPDGSAPVNAATALGGFANGTTPLELASAYSVFANGGAHLKAHFIDRIENGQGQVLYEAQPQPTQVFDPQVNAAIVDIMQDVVASGTGTRARLPGWRPAGKTGTTQLNADAWFVGTVPVLSTAVWVGHPEGQVPMRGATGGGLAAPLWQDFMTRVLEGVEPVDFPDVDYPRPRVAPAASTEIPDVRGLSDAEAHRLLTDRRLVAYSTDVPSAAPQGTVLWQNPRAGSALVGDNVEIGVSTGQAPPPEPEEDETEAPDDGGSPSSSESPRNSSGGDEDGEDEDGDGR